jgi:hypothetical protein
VALKVSYVCEYTIAKLCWTQAEVILNHVNPNVRDIGREVRHRRYRKLKLGFGQAYETAVSE